MPKILAAEIRVENLLEWNKHLKTDLKCYHVDEIVEVVLMRILNERK
ncbi:MAG: hypothetical protein K2X04_08640 [Burkholderiales bacterium]|nr:hypothetical protein [Burkholderiales bacterium]